MDYIMPQHFFSSGYCFKKLFLFDNNNDMTNKPIVIGAVATETKVKGLDDLEIGGQVETIQTTTLLRTARILRREMET